MSKGVMAVIRHGPKNRASSYGNSISRVVVITHDQRRTAVHAKNNNIDVAVL
jgi:hypothetical protein